MTNFAINFTLPWLLLLLIPAVILTFWPYFRLAKRYRRTRNRIISIVLHLLILVMSISVLSGMTFTYDIPNEENEIVVIVDMSHSSIEDHVNSDNIFVEKTRFVRDVLEESDSLYKVGIVAFGYKPVTVVEPTFDWEVAYETFVMFADDQATENKVIDETASDISAALEHAANIVAKKDGAKLLVVTDGIETDGDALATVQRLAAEGVKVDVAAFGEEVESEVEIIDVEMPEGNIKLNEIFEIKVTVKSMIAGEATLTVSDIEMSENDFNYQPVSHTVNLTADVNEYVIQHKFDQLMGMHRLRFNITQQNDGFGENNEYYTYVYLQKFDKILMLEGFSGEATPVKEALINYGEYEQEDITVVNINPENGNFASVPKTVDELRNYDQVVLVNVANSDLLNSNPLADAPNYNAALEANYMPVGFDEMLNDYVEIYGGGMLYVGGNEPGTEDTPHAFNDVDINYTENENKSTLDNPVYHTALKEMLPIDVVEYTPPIAVMLIIDRSNSMEASVNGKTYLEWAKDAAKECLSALSYRDYMGTRTFSDTYEIPAQISSVLERQTIIAEIDAIKSGGGTAYAGAIQRASQALAAIGDDKVAARHVIIISDGDPNDAANTGDGNGWAEILQTYHTGNAKITYSMLDISGNPKGDLQGIFSEENSGGIYETVSAGELPNLPQLIRDEIKTGDIESYVNEQFTPAVQMLNSGVLSGLGSEQIALMPQLTGYYGTRAKGAANTVLRAPYVPFYSEWNFGKGRVGAMMTNFDETNKVFLTNFIGQTIMSNIVTGLMPSEDIRPKDINVILTEENYNTRVSVSTSIEAGQKVRITVTALGRINEGDYTPQVVELSEADGYSRANIEITDPGVHSLLVEKYVYNAQGQVEVISSNTVYKTFSYSKEYDVFVNQTTIDEFIEDLAEKGRGSVVDQSDEDGIPNIFRDFDAGVSKVFDPRYLFMILAIIFFLLDIAVRKFKFKWPHEIIRDYKERKKLAK